MDKYAKTIEAVIRAETDTIAVGDALNEEIQGDESTKSFDEVSKEIQDKAGIEYSPEYLRNLSRTAKAFPADVRTKYRKQGIYPSVLMVCATKDAKKRTEILDDIVLVVDDLKFEYGALGFIDTLPESVAQKLTYPAVFTKRTLQLLWSHRSNTWIPTKSAVLEAFGVKNDRSEKTVTAESVFDVIESDTEIKAEVLRRFVAEPATVEVQEEKKERVVVAEVETRVDENVRAEYTVSALTKAINKARDAYYSALERFPDAEEHITDKVKQDLLEAIEVSQDVAVALKDMVDNIVILDTQTNQSKGSTK